MKSDFNKIKKQLRSISILSEKLDLLKNQQDQAHSVFSEKVSNFINEEFKRDFGNDLTLYFRVHLKTDEQYIIVDSISSFKRSQSGYWFTVNEKSGYNFYESTTTKVIPPIQEIKLKLFFNTIENKTGLPVKLREHTILGAKDIKRVKSKHDLITKYGSTLQVLLSGKIWYQGWEIDDQFYICWNKENKSYRLFYTDDGHGFGNEIEVVKTKAALAKFFKLISENNQNKEVIKKFKTKVYKNWKLS